MGKQTTTEFIDSYFNAYLGVGGGDDKSSHGSFKNMLSLEFNYTQLNNMWDSSPFARHVCSIIPDDMTRKWRTFNSDDIDNDHITLLKQKEKDLNTVELFNLAQKYANVYGNAYILLDVDDGNNMDFSKPLDVTQIKPNAHLKMRVLDRGTLYGTQPCLDIFDDNYLKFNYYTPPTNTGQQETLIHHTRVLVFVGNERSPYGKMTNSYFDASLLTGVYENVLNIDNCLGAMALGILDANLEVVKIKGLMENMVDPSLGAQTVKYAQQASRKTSRTKPRVIDGDDDIDVLKKDLSGIVEVFHTLCESVASSQGIPFTKFLGYSPSGLNSTGESDLQIYYDKVSQKQVTEFNPHLHKLDIIMGKVLGFEDDMDYSFVWNSLEEMNDKEKSDILKSMVEAMGKLLDSGVIETSHVFTELRKAGYLSSTPENWKDTLEAAQDEVNQQLRSEFSAAIKNSNGVEKEEGGSSSSNPLSA